MPKSHHLNNLHQVWMRLRVWVILGQNSFPSRNKIINTRNNNVTDIGYELQTFPFKRQKKEGKVVTSCEQFLKSNRANSIMFQGLGKNSLWLKARVLFCDSDLLQILSFSRDIKSVCFRLSSFISLFPACKIWGVNSPLSFPSLSYPFNPSCQCSCWCNIIKTLWVFCVCYEDLLH